MTARIRYILLLVIATTIVISCSKEKLAESSLDCGDDPIIYEDVSTLISGSCGYSGCHTGTASSNYNNFAGLKNALNNGDFSFKVFDIRDMPPKKDEEGNPITPLTQEELDLLLCWNENGYSEF